MYHASLTERSKREIYIQFSSRFSQLWCLVATIAFGMVWTCTKIEILTDARELQSCADDDLVKVCEQTENCRRSTLLRSLGSNEIVDASSGTPCCDVCSAIMYQV